MFSSNMRSLYTLLCVAKSLATLGCMQILTYKIFVHLSGGRVARAKERALHAKAYTRFQF